MNEREAEAFLAAPIYCTPAPDPDRFSRMGWCSKCFRGDHIDPPAICGDCEAASEAAEIAAEEAAFVDELEFERDQAFEALFS